MIKNFFIIKNLLTILGIKDLTLIFFLFIFILASIIDIISLGLIAPFIIGVLNPAELQEYDFVKYFKTILPNNYTLLIGYLLIIVFFFKTIFTIFIRWLIKKFSLKLEKQIQFDLMRIYLNLDFKEFIKRNSAELIRNIRDLSQSCAVGIDNLLKVISESIILIVILFFLSSVSFKSLFFLFSVIFLVFLLYQILLKPINLQLGKIRVNSLQNQYKYIDTGIKGFKEIKAVKKENFITKKLNYYNQLIFDANLKSSLITDTPRYVLEITLLISSIIIILFVKKNFGDLSSIIPTIGVFLFAGLRILPGSATIVAGINTIFNNINAIEIVSKDLNLKSIIDKNKDQFKNNRLEKFSSLRFEKCSFKYQNSTNKIFDEIDFQLRSNECIGIQGESGSGKTTFIDIILGFLNPHEGKIYFNDKIVKNSSIMFYCNSAYMPQDPFILDEDLITNITLESDDEKINQMKLQNAIKHSNIAKFVENLPHGIKTVIGGKKGVRLSGGQYRRLALARAFYHGKDLIVMDEATSSLDLENENLILDQIKDMKGKITIIVISHQKNTLKYCDKVYEIKKNKIILKS